MTGEWSLGQICLGTGMTTAHTREGRVYISSIRWRATGSSPKGRALPCGKYEAHMNVKGMQAAPIHMHMNPEGSHADF